MSSATPEVGAYTGPADLDEDARKAVEMLLFRLADDEFVVAERYNDWIVRAPTLESDLSLANIMQDELGHARLWYLLLQDFGYDEGDLVYERDPGDFRHATLLEHPYDTGDWADAVVRTYLYDMAERERLEALAESTYAPLADRVGKVQREEAYHQEFSQSWVERIASDESGRKRLQAAVDRLLPRALTLFEPTGDVETTIDELGLRTASLDDLRSRWLDTVVPFLESYGLEVPFERDDDLSSHLPAAVGRDRTHTEAWDELHDSLTHSYEELGRSEPVTIMEDES